MESEKKIKKIVIMRLWATKQGECKESMNIPFVIIQYNLTISFKCCVNLKITKKDENHLLLLI